MPFKTKIDGPANVNYQFGNMDIIDEAFAYFRVNVLFKNFEIKGNPDKVLIYLFVFLSHLFKTLEQMYTCAYLAKMSPLQERDSVMC